MTAEIKRTWTAYAAAPVEDDKKEWAAFTGACADAGIYVSDAIAEIAGEQ